MSKVRLAIAGGVLGATLGVVLMAGAAAAQPQQPRDATYPVPISYQVEIKAWIPFAHVVDPLRLLTIPYLTNLEGNCFIPASTLDKVRTTVSSFYRGDTHVAYSGSYRVSSIVSFDWDGSSISHLSARGSYGTTHRDLEYHTPSGTMTCNIAAATATTATSGSGSGASFNVGYASKNPLVVPQAATPAIDSALSGSVAANGTLTLNYSDDLFPSHGIEVVRNGATALTDTIGDASCLGPSHVVGAAGAAILAWGLTHQTNRGTLSVSPTSSGVVRSTPSPLCSASLWSTLVSSVKSAAGGSGSSARAASVGGASIRVAAITGGLPGPPMSLSDAERAGLVSVTESDAGTLITSATTTPVQIIASGSHVVLQTTEIVGGQPGATSVYGPFDGTVVLSAGQTATVTKNGTAQAPHAHSSKPPVTTAKVKLAGKRARVHLRAHDRAGVAYTRAFVGNHRVRLKHDALTIPRTTLARLRFYSVDTLGNVERAHGLTRRQLRKAGHPHRRH